ncbi:MAG: hypothetical protein MUF54_04265 [Polyangiaceae bacterium]|jgi:phosphomevalonate kinase|nr:hypothetical protein [Polyangiaceae bacterium]
MLAQAPGKLVLSGAYAVLEGAPAIVTAVDRFVVADTSRDATFVTPEVRAALGDAPAPWIDANALRREGRKLGLGSSAAIVVASLAALELEQDPAIPTDELAERVWPTALRAHRQAQGGGSGIDVVTCAKGGTLCCWREPAGLQAQSHPLPSDLHVAVYAAREACATRDMLKAVSAFAAVDPAAYATVVAALTEASILAVDAVTAAGLAESVAAQVAYLTRLGDGAGVPIVPAGLRPTIRRARDAGVCISPSGAGGGDIVLEIRPLGETESWAKQLAALGLSPLDVRIGAPGVCRLHNGATCA